MLALPFTCTLDVILALDSNQQLGASVLQVTTPKPLQLHENGRIENTDNKTVDYNSQLF